MHLHLKLSFGSWFPLTLVSAAPPPLKPLPDARRHAFSLQHRLGDRRFSRPPPGSRATPSDPSVLALQCSDSPKSGVVSWGWSSRQPQCPAAAPGSGHRAAAPCNNSRGLAGCQLAPLPMPPAPLHRQVSSFMAFGSSSGCSALHGSLHCLQIPHHLPPLQERHSACPVCFGHV